MSTETATSSVVATALPEFTRYLYLKSDVMRALAGSILNNDRETSYFWAFELYFSGFRLDVLATLWRVYFEFYATLNPLLETYLKRKETETKTDEERELFICVFVSNLLVRKHTTDVFILKKIATSIEIDEEDAVLTLEERLVAEKYEAIAHYIFDKKKERNALVDTLTTFFANQQVKIKIEKKHTNKHVDAPTILLARVLMGFEMVRTTQSKKKNLYVVPAPDAVESYRTCETTYPTQMAYQFFRTVVKHSPDQYGMVSLERDELPQVYMDIFRDGRKWMPTACSTTPLWRERITAYCTIPPEKGGDIIWKSDDHEEEFCERFWFDTDEQPLSIQERCMPRVKKDVTAMRKFQESHNNLGMVSLCEETLECLSE